MSKVKAKYSDDEEIRSKYPSLWSDDGSLGLGYVHAPNIDVDHYHIISSDKNKSFEVYFYSKEKGTSGRCYLHLNQPITVSHYHGYEGESTPNHRNSLVDMNGLIFKDSDSLYHHFAEKGALVTKCGWASMTKYIVHDPRPGPTPKLPLENAEEVPSARPW